MAERRVHDSAAWRLLRVLLPSSYRRVHADDLLRTYIDAAGGNAAARGLRFWLSVAWDVVLTAIQLRVDGLHRGGSAVAAGRRAPFGSRLTRIVAHALRDVRARPGFAFAVAVTLGLGIGANATMYTVMDRMLFSPPEHVQDASGVRRIYMHGKSIFSKDVVYAEYLAFPDYVDYTKVRGFSGVAGYTAQTLTMGHGADSEQLDVELASASYFPLLGVHPFLGRFYTNTEDAPTVTHPPAVLSYNFWQHRFGGARSVMGRVLDIGKGHYTVVGIAPRGFTGANLGAVQVWLPLQTAYAIETEGTDWKDARGWSWMGAIARLAPGVTDQVAMAEATAVWRAGHANDKSADHSAQIFTGSLIQGRGPDQSRETKVTKALGVVALLVLLIACANAGNLFLAHGVQQRRTYAVQSALGVSRGELIQQLFCESTIIAMIAGVFAFGLARLAGPAVFRLLLPDSTPPTAAGLRIALVTFAFSLFTAVAAGLLTAIRSSRIAPIEVLRAGRSGGRTSALRRSLVALQASLAVVLVIGAGLFLRSLQHARTLDMGLALSTEYLQFETNNGDAFGSNLESIVYPALQRIREHPAVESATVTSIPPYYGYWGVTVDVPGPDSVSAQPYYFAAGGDYFRTVGLKILRGRALTEQDDADHARVMVVNEAMARATWPGREAVGQCLIVVPRKKEPACSTVVGVSSNYLPSVEGTTPARLMYLPPHHPDAPPSSMSSVLVRMKPGREAAIADIQSIARSSSPDVRFVKATTLQELIAPQLQSWQLGAAMLTAFGVLALLVAAAGLYSVLAFEVAQRRFELGVRSALGATSSRIVRSLVNEVFRTTTLGIVLGFVAAVALGRVAGALFFGVTPTDPVVYAATLMSLIVVGAIAAVVPAVRAVRTSPGVALTSE